MRMNELTELCNIGSTVAKRLNEIGVFNRNDLKRMGSVIAYQKMKQKHPDATLPRCYYLYSLEGALRNSHWDKLPESLKRKLSIAAGLEAK